MGFFDKLFGSEQKINSNTNRNSPKRGTPINESLGFLAHLEHVEREFNFLSEEFRFQRTKQDWVGREHITHFERDNVRVELVYEAGSLPSVQVRNTSLVYDESQKLYNATLVEEFNQEIVTIRKRYNARRVPLREKAMKVWRDGGILDFSELDDDYEKRGKEEHIAILVKSSEVVRSILKQKRGVLKGT